MSASTAGTTLTPSRISLRSSGLRSLWLRNGQVSFHSCTLRMLSLSRRQASRHVVWQPAHTFGLKRVVARERAALFTDLPQMRVEH